MTHYSGEIEDGATARQSMVAVNRNGETVWW